LKIPVTSRDYENVCLDAGIVVKKIDHESAVRLQKKFLGPLTSADMCCPQDVRGLILPEWDL
jgi:hypothetical protein